ncbi:hypothetical protein [Cytobacillus sp. IB215665]|nr:hypothetical protein [Cytobacillus sp. IB215665]MDX8366713.1 hypothetical protein [Cytobacillus sp. IB215665]
MKKMRNIVVVSVISFGLLAAFAPSDNELAGCNGVHCLGVSSL